MDSHVHQALSLFEAARQVNPYLYFELAYTKTTGWMCWVIDKQRGGRNVLAEYQGDTPEAACMGALDALEALVKQYTTKD